MVNNLLGIHKKAYLTLKAIKNKNNKFKTIVKETKISYSHSMTLLRELELYNLIIANRSKTNRITYIITSKGIKILNYQEKIFELLTLLQ